MDLQMRGVKAMGGKQLTARHNAVAVSTVVSAVAERTRRAAFSKNGAALQKFSLGAAAKLVKLREMRPAAEKALARVDERKEAGELDEYSSAAEAAAPRIMLELADKLESLFQKANEARDVYTLGRVMAAAHSLATSMEGNLLNETLYAKDPEVYSQQVVGNIQNARRVLSSVSRALNCSQSEYGMQLPENPHIPLQ